MTACFSVGAESATSPVARAWLIRDCSSAPSSVSSWLSEGAGSSIGSWAFLALPRHAQSLKSHRCSLSTAGPFLYNWMRLALWRHCLHLVLLPPVDLVCAITHKLRTDAHSLRRGLGVTKAFCLGQYRSEVMWRFAHPARPWLPDCQRLLLARSGCWRSRHPS